MQDYRTLTLENIYAPDEITDALSLLQSCGIESIVNPSNITLNFDIVDLKMLESTTQNTLVQKTLEELYKIRSFSSQNGKIVFKSFNKAKKVANKTQRQDWLTNLTKKSLARRQMRFKAVLIKFTAKIAWSF